MVQLPLQEHFSRSSEDRSSSLKCHLFRAPPTTQIEVAPLQPLTGHSFNLFFLQSMSPYLSIHLSAVYLFSPECKPCMSKNDVYVVQS